MQDYGINALHHPLERCYMPFFDVTRGQTQDDMHNEDDGILSTHGYQTFHVLLRKWKSNSEALGIEARSARVRPLSPVTFKNRRLAAGRATRTVAQREPITPHNVNDQ